jgi:hypothetical protein
VSRLVYVQAGTPTVRIHPAAPVPALLAPGPADAAADRPTEVAPGAEATLAPGDLLALPAATRFTLLNDAGVAAEVFLLVADPADGLTPPTGRPDPAFTSAGAGAPLLNRYGADIDPGTATASPPVEVTVEQVAGGRTTGLPAGPARVAVGRATLAPGSELRALETTGPALLCVEGGTLGFTTSDGAAWETRGPDRASTEQGEGMLAVGDGALLQPGSGIVLRNPGDEPVVVLLVTILPDPRRGP